MICKWAHGNAVFEFDADTRAEEMRKLRELAKERGYKLYQMVREE